MAMLTIPTAPVADLAFRGGHGALTGHHDRCDPNERDHSRLWTTTKMSKKCIFDMRIVLAEGHYQQGCGTDIIVVLPL